MFNLICNSELPFSVLEAMGGQDNIKHLDACITRLRVEVQDKDPSFFQRKLYLVLH